ncbi:MAG TPA: shikimate dehydrogenase [Sporosarcina sp.]|nr:shikimate dehydrogenase [Sporosarcina sp.]
MKKWYSVIGDPIHQSMSPQMHDEWFTENAVDATYTPHHVTKDALEKAVQSLKHLGCSGWNVTVPHKTAIIRYLDEIDATAKHMNAVNTVVVTEEGRLRGYNTDGDGFVRSLEEQFGDVAKGNQVLVIGAGGAARGICFALEAHGYGPITIANRTIEKAEQLADDLQHAKPISLADAENTLATFSLIIQTTSVGMNYAKAGIPINMENVAKDTIVADIIYNPLETEFLQEAKKHGAKTMNGVGMFVHQGAIAFEKWTGICPNTKDMIDQITTKLGGTLC